MEFFDNASIGASFGVVILVVCVGMWYVLRRNCSKRRLYGVNVGCMG